MVKFINEWRAETGHTRRKIRSPSPAPRKTVTFEVKSSLECLKKWKKMGEEQAEQDKKPAIHIFSKAQVWEKKHHGKNLRFRRYQMPPNITPNHIIGIAREGKSARGWAMSEVWEEGFGKWSKGTTFRYGSSKAELSLKEIGWTKERGREMSPVWICVHPDTKHSE